jgi:hypothetical protein
MYYSSCSARIVKTSMVWYADCHYYLFEVTCIVCIVLLWGDTA